MLARTTTQLTTRSGHVTWHSSVITAWRHVTSNCLERCHLSVKTEHCTEFTFVLYLVNKLSKITNSDYRPMMFIHRSGMETSQSNFEMNAGTGNSWQQLLVSLCRVTLSSAGTVRQRSASSIYIIHNRRVVKRRVKLSRCNRRMRLGQRFLSPVIIPVVIALSSLHFVSSHYTLFRFPSPPPALVGDTLFP